MEPSNRPREVEKKTLQEGTWLVRREGKVEEIIYEGGTIRYRVKIWDKGRDAFITTTFNDATPALDFYDRVKAENEATAQEVL